MGVREEIGDGEMGIMGDREVVGRKGKWERFLVEDLENGVTVWFKRYPVSSLLVVLNRWSMQLRLHIIPLPYIAHNPIQAAISLHAMFTIEPHILYIHCILYNPVI